jgi:hypothetical protein
MVAVFVGPSDQGHEFAAHSDRSNGGDCCAALGGMEWGSTAPKRRCGAQQINPADPNCLRRGYFANRFQSRGNNAYAKA